MRHEFAQNSRLSNHNYRGAATRTKFSLRAAERANRFSRNFQYGLPGVPIVHPVAGVGAHFFAARFPCPLSGGRTAASRTAVAGPRGAPVCSSPLPEDRLIRISHQPRKGRQIVAHGASRGIVGTDRNKPRRGDRPLDRLWRCFLSPLPGLVGSNDPFHGLTPVARFCRASLRQAQGRPAL